MKKIAHILALLSVLTTNTSNAQQAWTKPKGKFYTQIGASYLNYNSLINGTAGLIPLNKSFADLTLQAYGEYGITDKLTVSGSIPFRAISSSNSTKTNAVKEGSLAAFSNIQAALTANFYNKDGVVISGKTQIALPTAKYDAPTGLRSGFDATSVTPSVLVGFGHAKFFTSGEIGYVFRNNNYSNRFMMAAQIGKFFGTSKKHLGIIGFELMNSLDGGTHDDGNSVFTGSYLDKQSFLSPNIKYGYKATSKITTWFSAGFGLRGVTKSVGASPGLSFSVSYQN